MLFSGYFGHTCLTSTLPVFFSLHHLSKNIYIIKNLCRVYNGCNSGSVVKLGSRVITIFINAPQKEQTICFRGLSLVIHFCRFSRNTHCNIFISFLLLGCKNPYSLARLKPRGRICRNTNHKKWTADTVLVWYVSVLLFLYRNVTFPLSQDIISFSLITPRYKYRLK